MGRIFEYLSVRKYLQDWIKANKALRSGLQSRLAKVAGCRPSFISQVLNGSSLLSLEQAERISRFLQLTDIEEEYMLNLILWERAATQELKSKLDKNLQRIRENSLNLTQRLTPLVHQASEDEAIKAQYYSNWIYPAVHVSVGLQQLSNAYVLSKALNVEEPRIQEALEFLMHAKLIEEKKGEYYATPFSFHLGKDSPYLNQHHRNMHNLAIRQLDNYSQTDLQYSGFMTLSKNDAHRIKDSLAAEIKKCVENAKLSEEEEVHLCQIGFLKIC